MNEVQQLIQRLEQLETQLAFQEDTIDALNQLVIGQNQELVGVQEQLRWLGRKISQLQTGDSGPEADPSNEPPPPHY